MNDSGYCLIHRSLIGHPDFKSDAEAMAFAWLILRASWRDTRVRYKGKAIDLKRGQLAISIRDMATALDRSKTWVERFLSRLKIGTMIETEAGQSATIVTICNYDKFQQNYGSLETAPGHAAGHYRDITGTQNNTGNTGKDMFPNGNKGREAQKSAPRKRPKAASFAVPDWIDKSAWDGFEEMRKRIKKPLTDHARELAVKGLATLKAEGHDPADVLNQSTMRGWAGLFAVKGNDHGNYRSSGNGRARPVNGFRAALDEAIAATDPDRDEFGGSLFPDGMG